MPDAITTLPAYRSPAAPSSVTWLPALVPSCPEKGQAPVISPLETGHQHSQPSHKENLCNAPAVPV